MTGFKRFAVRAVVTFVVGFGTALVVAVTLGIIDLYLTGHVLPSLGRPWIDFPAAGISMSYQDAILWAAVFGVGGLTWWGTGRILRGPA